MKPCKLVDIHNFMFFIRFLNKIKFKKNEFSIPLKVICNGKMTSPEIIAYR